MNIETDSYLTGVVVIFLFVSLSALGAVATRRIKNISKLLAHHEVMGYFFPVSGSIYGVLLGLVVVNSIAVFNESSSTVNSEASDLISIYLLSNNTDTEAMDSIQNSCRNYARSVIQYEWNAMDAGSHDPTSRGYALKLFDDIIKSSKKGDTISQKMLDVADDMWQKRRERIDLASRQIPTIEWLSLCLGGILIILLSYMFVMDSIKIQILAVTSISTMISLNLFLIICFGNPFSGDLRVSDEPFKNALNTFSQIDNYNKSQSIFPDTK